MNRKLDLNKEVFNKDQYSKVIDTNFNQLGVKSIQSQIDDTISIEQFFEYYNDLFYDIPQNGETNSHEFLVKESGEYISFDQISEEIEALQNEIAGLRQQLLDEQVKNLELTTGEKIDLSSTGSNA